jgi:hypothetical protein
MYFAGAKLIRRFSENERYTSFPPRLAPGRLSLKRLFADGSRMYAQADGADLRFGALTLGQERQ